MGRCGRAGKRNGRGIIFYGAKQRELIEIVQEAERQQERMVLEQDVDEIEDGEQQDASVKKAFSRKRGFTKKRKKARRYSQEQ
jgi:superfamily II DNA/RNA helicase